MTKTKPSKPDGLNLSAQLCFATYSASQAFNRVYKPLLDPLGLTYSQYLVMLVLWDGDDVTVSEIGAGLHLDSGTLTPLLKRMEAAGFVNRQRNPDDEREVRITLTDSGKKLRGAVAEARSQVACATKLSQADLGGLKEKLIKLRDDLNGSISP